jgi:hypothetical protein
VRSRPVAPLLTDVWLFQALSRLPRCTIRWSLRPARPGQDASTQEVEVQLQRRRVGPGRSGAGKGFRAFAPRFPKVKEEGWWLVVGTPETRELHALKRVSFGDRLVTRLTIPRRDSASHQVRHGQPGAPGAAMDDPQCNVLSVF